MSIPKGEMVYRSPLWKAAREEREKLKEAAMEVDSETHKEESAKIQSPKKKGNPVRIGRNTRLCL